MNKPIIYIDMDGVIADFSKAIKTHPKSNLKPYQEDPDNIPGIFEHLELITGAKGAIHQLHLSNKYDLFILTTAPWDNPSAWMHKRLWIEKHFGDIFYKKVIITHRKDLLIGDYLIDDRTANGAGNFKGTHLHFGWDYINNKDNIYPNWEAILTYFNQH
ncbi:5' nucleotidase, NT5C type [Winogradskyella poriferorum]|uniref:5' nucleotidase, NT5C type n=1 Tax=Winogradskyella poriferorum TaxID=307627 RepID=UPI003D65F2FE